MTRRPLVLHHQVRAYLGPRLAWPRTLFAAAVVAGSSAVAQGEWQGLAETPEGSAWSWRKGSVAVETVKDMPHRVVIVQRTGGGFVQIFKAAIRPDHCAAKRGDVLLLTLHGALVETTAFWPDRPNVALALSKVLCREGAL